MNIQTPIVEKTTGRPGGGITPGATPHERNEHYHRKALENIRSRADKLGARDIADTEDDMKQLVAYVLGINEDQAEIVYEIFERAISCHYKKINPAN